MVVRQALVLGAVWACGLGATPSLASLERYHHPSGEAFFYLGLLWLVALVLAARIPREAPTPGGGEPSSGVLFAISGLGIVASCVLVALSPGSLVPLVAPLGLVVVVGGSLGGGGGALTNILWAALYFCWTISTLALLLGGIAPPWICCNLAWTVRSLAYGTADTRSRAFRIVHGIALGLALGVQVWEWVDVASLRRFLGIDGAGLWDTVGSTLSTVTTGS